MECVNDYTEVEGKDDMTRTIVHRTRGHGHAPIVRLMSPSDLGEHLKPFVFLDLFEADMRALAGSIPYIRILALQPSPCSQKAT